PSDPIGQNLFPVPPLPPARSVAHHRPSGIGAPTDRPHPVVRTRHQPSALRALQSPSLRHVLSIFLRVVLVQLLRAAAVSPISGHDAPGRHSSTASLRRPPLLHLAFGLPALRRV